LSEVVQAAFAGFEERVVGGEAELGGREVEGEEGGGDGGYEGGGGAEAGFVGVGEGDVEVVEAGGELD
jgi:hypothetical protein